MIPVLTISLSSSFINSSFRFFSSSSSMSPSLSFFFYVFLAGTGFLSTLAFLLLYLWLLSSMRLSYMIVSLNGMMGSETLTLHSERYFSKSVIHLNYSFNNDYLYRCTSPQVPRTNSPFFRVMTSTDGSALFNFFSP